jgi:hypothetical protein
MREMGWEVQMKGKGRCILTVRAGEPIKDGVGSLGDSPRVVVEFLEW